MLRAYGTEGRVFCPPDKHATSEILMHAHFAQTRPTRRSKRSQICSIGDKSGDQAGQGRVVTVRRQSCDTLAVRGRALSC
ncbi:hypothetical protein TNCV_396441 [Trichonephila clavipes]|nr:hypothetical protein TNCV_396441 [Trichonephila clavipes]